MKELFPGYYRPTKQELTRLWDKCIFVLDASVLLNLYRYTPETSAELLAILRGVSDRLWVPHQAALEYQRNRHIVIAQQREAYAEIKEYLEKTLNQVDAKLNSYQRHPYIDVSRLSRRMKTSFSRIGKELDVRYKEHPDLIENDNLRETITSLFAGKVGPSYSAARMGEIYKEGEDRYKRNVPPGYMDAATKADNNKYGDLIVWLQILDKVQEAKKPVIFVTDDAKEDWWWKFKGRTLAPRPELIEEIVGKAGVAFHMYRSDQFMEYARDYLKRKVHQQAIDEVRSLRKQDDELKMHQTWLHHELLKTEMDYQRLQSEINYVETRLSELQREADVESAKTTESVTPDESENADELARLGHSREDRMLRDRRADLRAQLDRLLSERLHLSHQQEDIRHRLRRIELETGE